MIGIMQHNLGMKLLALMLAIGVWGFLRAKDPIMSLWIELNVEVQLSQDTVLVSREIEEQAIYAYATGPETRVSKLRSSDTVAILDCRNIDPDVPTEVTFELNRRIPGVDVNFEPESIVVTINEVRTQPFPPEQVSLGNLPPGLQINSIAGLPPTVEVQGASSIVDRVDSVIYVLNQWALSAGSTELTVEFIAVDVNDEPLKYIDIDPPEKDIELSLASIDYWIIPVKVDYRGEPPPNYNATRFSHEPGRVEVSGPGEVLENIQWINTRPVDLTNRTETFSQTVTLVAPTGVTISVDRVTVRVGIESIETPYVFPGLTVAVRNKDPNLAYEIQVETVTVFMKALPSRTTPVIHDLVRPEISLDGLGPGTHDVRVTVGLPTETQLERVDPEFITVVVTGSSDPEGVEDPENGSDPEGTPDDPVSEPEDDPISAPE